MQCQGLLVHQSQIGLRDIHSTCLLLVAEQLGYEACRQFAQFEVLAQDGVGGPDRNAGACSKISDCPARVLSDQSPDFVDGSPAAGKGWTSTVGAIQTTGIRVSLEAKIPISDC